MPTLYVKRCVSQKAHKHCDILYRHLHSDTVVDSQTSIMIDGVHTNVTKHDNSGGDLKISRNGKTFFWDDPSPCHCC